MKARQVLMLAVGFALILGFAVQAQAQEEGAKVEIGEGRVMHASGETLIVDVKKGTHLGIQRFDLREVKHLKFYKYGKEIQPQDLKKDDMVTAYADNAVVVPVTITYEDVEKVEAAAPASEPAPAAAPAPAPAARPAPAPAPAPAALPSTGSHLPLILVLAVAFLAVGLTLTVLRRF